MDFSSSLFFLSLLPLSSSSLFFLSLLPLSSSSFSELFASPSTCPAALFQELKAAMPSSFTEVALRSLLIRLCTQLRMLLAAEENMYWEGEVASSSMALENGGDEAEADNVARVRIFCNQS